jgi:hypothetical protein
MSLLYTLLSPLWIPLAVVWHSVQLPLGAVRALFSPSQLRLLAEAALVCYQYIAVAISVGAAVGVFNILLFAAVKEVLRWLMPKRLKTKTKAETSVTEVTAPPHVVHALPATAADTASAQPHETIISARTLTRAPLLPLSPSSSSKSSRSASPVPSLTLVTASVTLVTEPPPKAEF